LLAIRFDAETTAARLALARALIRHREAAGLRQVGLVFSCSAGDLQTGLQAGLRDLMVAVTRESGSWSLFVRIRFVYPEPTEHPWCPTASLPSGSPSAVTASGSRMPIRKAEGPPPAARAVRSR
jgi:hypothetical protein